MGEGRRKRKVELGYWLLDRQWVGVKGCPIKSGKPDRNSLNKEMECKQQEQYTYKGNH